MYLQITFGAVSEWKIQNLSLNLQYKRKFNYVSKKTKNLQYVGTRPWTTDTWKGLENATKISTKGSLFQLTVHVLQNNLELPPTKTDIKEFASYLCDKYLPKEIRELCEGFLVN